MLRRSALLLSLALVLGACDTTDNDVDGSLEVFVTDLRFDADDFRVVDIDLDIATPAELKTATFYASDAQVVAGDALDDALATVGDGDLVMLYIDTELVSPVDGAEGGGTWSALPLARGFDQLVFGDTDGDDESDGDVFVTGYFASYEYSFDNGNLYFDVVSSLPYTDFGVGSRAFFRSILPTRFGEAPGDIDLRLVVIPDELFFSNRAAARVDLRDYEAVKAAFGLPD